MTNHRKNVRVTGARPRRSPDAIQHLGRAPIALSRAQLEAEAQAEHQDRPVPANRSKKRPRPRSPRRAP